MRSHFFGFKLLAFYLFCLLISFASTSLGATDSRPKVGLVLGGGGAKGSAHIGVLKVLEEHGIVVDYIAGTSIGAYVGGMYALGYRPDEIEHLMLNGQWHQGYSDKISRRDLTFRDKQHRDKYNLPLQLGYSEHTLQVPKGLLLGQSMNRLLRSSTDLVHAFDSFDDLAIPFRAVATDLATSKAVILKQGSIIDAMQASASVPGVVQPMEMDGLALVDGGIANNLPVDVVKAMGADIVIAVDIGSPLADKTQLNSTFDVFMQLSTMLTKVSTEYQLGLLDEQDILIQPDVGQLSTTDWSVLPVALTRGVDAANQRLSRLKPLATSPKQFVRAIAMRKAKSEDWFKALDKPIVAVVLDNQSHASDELILDKFAIEAGQTVTEHDVQKALKRVYGMDMFERVDSDFKDTEQGRILQLRTREKSWGPNYLDFGASYQDDFNADSVFSLDVAYTLTNLNQYGAKWRNQLSLGYEKMIATDFYQPLNITQDYYFSAQLGFAKDERRIQSAKSTFVDLQKKYAFSEFELGYHYAYEGLIKLFIEAQKGNVRNQDQQNQRMDYHQYGLGLGYEFDNLNDINFPTSGNRLSISIIARNETYPDLNQAIEDGQSYQYTFDWRGAVSINNHAFLGIASFSKLDKDGAFSVNVAELGGFLNLSGYAKNTLIGSHKAFAGLVYQYDLSKTVFDLGKYPLYSGVSLEAGNVWSLEQTISLSDLIGSGSVYIGTDMAFGPMAFGLGFAEQGQSNVFISIGKNWW